MKAKLLQIAFAILGLGVLASAGPVTISFISGGPSNPGGIPYYPYTISVNGTDMTVACDDFLDHVAPPETYNGWATNLGSGDLSHTLFAASDPNGYAAGVTNGTEAYSELAYLDSYLVASSSPSTETAAINYAMWELFDGGTSGNAYNADPTLGNTGVNNSQYWLAQAAANYSTVDLSEFVVYSPTSDTTGWIDGRPQEFIGEVPEPATLALLGTGLLVLGLAFRRRLSTEGANL